VDSPRRILHVDADAFFVGVARLADPDGAGQAPLLIVGGRPGGRGVVCSASYETRRFGVRSAMPIARALRLCPDAMCVPVPSMCGAKSREIRAVLERWSPVVEAASIDEWYLDLSGTERLYGDEPLEATAARIRAAVHDATGLTVSVGGGPGKLVAKLAVELAKPSRSGTGVHIVAPSAVQEFLDALPLAAIPGIGPRAQERLHRFGLVTVAEARARGTAGLTALLGPTAGAWLAARISGEDHRLVQPRAARKQISNERTFGQDVIDDARLQRRLLALASRVAIELRAQELRCRTITVKLRDARFRTSTASHTLTQPVESDKAIRAVVRRLFAVLRRRLPGPVRLIGVAVSGFGAEARVAQQLGLFGAPARAPDAESERDRQLSRALDRVRRRFGDGALHLGEGED
jgi:DNA polymerase-4